MKPDPKFMPASALDISSLSEKDKEEALIRAKRKLADEWAMRELNVGDHTAPVRKGPPPGLVEDEFTITLDLYEGCDRLIVDSKIYMHGGTYTVGKSTYDTLREMVSRGWGHQREIDGKPENAYRKEQNMILKPNTQGV